MLHHPVGLCCISKQEMWGFGVFRSPLSLACYRITALLCSGARIEHGRMLQVAVGWCKREKTCTWLLLLLVSQPQEQPRACFACSVSPCVLRTPGAALVLSELCQASEEPRAQI